MSIVHDEDIILCFGCHCCNVGLYDKHCLGCATEFSCICLESLCCLKMGEDPIWCGCASDQGKICRIGLGCISLGLIVPTNCCNMNGHYCCLALSGALLPGSRFRSSIACFGLVCSPEFGCCSRLNKVKRQSEIALPGGNEPITQQPGTGAA
mmetsp:Transcript_14029/g.17487  ORF Transcript_14029/g.17487 Transcript_14029/m.17487 type:complete len:152 (+) Transcript_14029:71-526(+)